MAVTRMTASRADLGRTLRYVTDPEKTTASGQSGTEEEKDKRFVPRRYVSGINCNPRFAEEQFDRTKQFWSAVTDRDKYRGNLYYSGYLSFAKGEVDAQTAHIIGTELARRLWGNSHEVVVATHLNAEHIHCHFVVNSVSWLDGGMDRAGKIAHHDLRIEADRICGEYGLSVIEEQYGRKGAVSEYLAEKDGKPTLRNIIRWDIDRAVRESLTFSEFVSSLEGMGYSLILQEDRKKGYPGIRPPEDRWHYSFKKLGAEYEIGRIKQRILERSSRDVKTPEQTASEVRRYRDRTEEKQTDAGLIGIWKKFRYELDLIVRFPQSVREIPFPIRKELIRLGRTEKAVQLLEENGIVTQKGLEEFIDRKEEYMEVLVERRSALDGQRLRALRKKDLDTYRDAADAMKAISTELKELRPQLKTARETAQRSGEIEKKLDMILDLGALNEREEERTDEQLRDRGGGSGREDHAQGS